MKPHEMLDGKGLDLAQIARIKFVQGNFFDDLPFSTDHFDFIRIAFLELAIPENKWAPLLKEAWRILKPGGHIEVIIETLLFPTVRSYEKLPVQSELEGEFRHMLEERDIPPTTNIGEKMSFDASARVQTHQHVSVCIAPRPPGHSSLNGLASSRKFGSMRSVHSSWNSEPTVRTGGMVSPTPYDRPSLDRSRTLIDVLPPAGHVITSQTCSVPGIVISPDTFIPVAEDTLYSYASHGARMLSSARFATFFDKHPSLGEHCEFDDNHRKEWDTHVERYWQYERENRDRLGFRNKSWDGDEGDDEIAIPPLGPNTRRWKWSKCDEDIERP
jgi:SAM-dependent methyltransferase